MKRVSVLLIMAMVAIWAVPVGMNGAQRMADQPLQYQMRWDSNALASVSRTGINHQSVAFMTRTVSGQTFQVLNSYSSPSQHVGQIDLTEYLIPGWSLDNVTMDVSSITAIAEKESTGVSGSATIDIVNASGSITDVLYQAFYNQPHDGKLLNYSLDYKTGFYDSGLGDATLGIRSDYSDSQTNVTDWITPFIQIGSYTTVTHDISSDGIVLNASNYYFAVIDGSVMTGFYASGWWFNTIYWRAQNFLGLETGYHIRDDPAMVYWYEYKGIPAINWEADLEYAYTPWNKTSNSALTYMDPSLVSLRGNLTSLSGMSWVFTDPSNVTVIDFDSNQSVEISCDITLRYTRDVTTSTVWRATGTGQDILWNATTVVSYPSTSEHMFLDVSVPATWTVTGLYNASFPAINHISRKDMGVTIRCWNLGNDTWTLTFTSRNYLTDLRTYDTSDDSEILSKNSISVNIDVNSTIQEEDSDPVMSGTTNLTIQHEGSTVWTPANQTVISGATHYLWNIPAASANGLYSFEEFWTNGTDAGYRTKDLILYYPTTLGAAQSQIDAFTESSFDISVDFDDIYTPQGLDGGFADVRYSFDSGTNTSMTDSGSGTWTATIPTTGKANGSYTVVVYAEGYALENRSVTIDVTLIHDTQPLVITWSDGNNISYVESTILSIDYRTVGNAPVTDATVNVTDGTTMWELVYDGGSETYRYTFHGSSLDLSFITHNLTILAWQKGYAGQSNHSQTLTIHRESTDIEIIWADSSSITYVQHTILKVNFTMSNGSAVVGAEVNVTIGSGEWDLTFNETTQTYDLTIFGDDATPGLGDHEVFVFAGKTGYLNATDDTQTLSIDLEPTSLVIDWSNGNNITYVQQTTLIVTYRMNNLTPISGAVVNVTIGLENRTLVWHNSSKTYRITFSGWDDPPGLGEFSLTIIARKTGYVGQTNTTESLIVIEDPTTLTVSWSSGYDITFIESTTLIVSYRMNDTTPIDDATVEAIIDGQPYSLEWHLGTQTYQYTFSGAADPPGFGTFNITITADKLGFRNNSDINHWITLREEPTTLTFTWIDLDTITYTGSTILAINYSIRSGDPVTGATVTVMIESAPWFAVYDGDSETYRVTFSGIDEPPGLGEHFLEITGIAFGFVTGVNNSAVLTIDPEETVLEILWDPDDDITFATYSILSVNYTMLDGTPISWGIVNTTIDTHFFEIPWNNDTKLYQLKINGSDVPPGFGNHSMFIQASKKGYVYQSTTDYVQLRIEPTSLVIEWSNGYDLGFYDHTYLFVDYRNAALQTIYDADLNVTIGTYTWIMTWNATAGRYQIRFNGSDSNPGVGTHNLIIKAGKSGYINLEDTNEELTLPIIPTSLVLEFSNGDDISYVQQTTLRAFYTMYNTTPIIGAVVNVTIDEMPYVLTWNDGTEAYEYTFHGSDVPPGFGNHSLSVLAGALDFEGQSNSSEYLNLRIEYTHLDITWSNGYNITYFNQTTLSVRYLMSDLLTPVDLALLNATINGRLYVLSWNATTSAYEATIMGTDDPPGYDTYQVVILASRFGFESQQNDTFFFTIRVQDTFLSFDWNPSNTTSYVSSTKLLIYYQMADGSPVIGASVNATYITPYIAIYNSTSKAYEIVFQGDDEFLIIGTNSLIIRAGKLHYQGHTDYTQKLIIKDEETSVSGFWSDGINDITYIQTATLFVSYKMSNGTEIPDALVDIRIGTDIFFMDWDSDLQLYYYMFRGSDSPPGIGSHGLSVKGWKEGYVETVNSSFTLTIGAEDVAISSKWLQGGLISYVNSTTLEVNYTDSEGTPISGANVNVTIDTGFWELDWHDPSKTYRITFNGTDSFPGFGDWSLIIRAGRSGFNSTTDTTKVLSVIREPTSLTIYWSTPHLNDITYFEHTFLFVRYRMSNGTDILGANLNATIGGDFRPLEWNATEGAYGVVIRGSDDPPGLGNHGLVVKASKYGYAYCEDTDSQISISKDPTSLEIQWPQGNSTTFIGSVSLVVYYRMSNDTIITTGTVTATIDGSGWPVLWNSTVGGYYLKIDGNWDPPGIGIHTVTIDASGDIYASQTTQNLLEIREDPTLAIASLPSPIIDWTQSVVLSVDYLDSLRRLIPGATQKTLTVNGTDYTLLGSNGTYWFEFDNSFGLGHFVVTVNISLYGYEFAVNSSISFDIVLAPTTITAVWSDTSIDYLEFAYLELSYEYIGGGVVPMGSVEANLTIDGTIDVELLQAGDVWIANLTGLELDLGSHDIAMRAQAYGYVYMETSEVIIVSPVNTAPLQVVWDPTNVTIEFTETLDLEVHYTFYGGDVPIPAYVNVTIDGHFYELNWGGTVWSVSIPGEELDVGVYDAYITAWAYGYADRVNTTFGINVTLAANLFGVVWDPVNRTPTYLDTVNVSVIYLEDFVPIENATVKLSINGTLYDLVYSETDQRWHFSIKASDIDLGVWNVTITANKTGYADAWYSDLLTVVSEPTMLYSDPPSVSIFYDEATTVDIFFELLNTTVLPSGSMTVTLGGTSQSIVWDIDHWEFIGNGTILGLGTHVFDVGASLYGHESQVSTFTIEVVRIPIRVVEFDPAIIVVTFLDSHTLKLNYLDNRTSDGIAGALIDVLWSDSTTVQDLPNGSYLIQFDTLNMHIGSYLLNVSLEKTGYVDGFVSIPIEINPIVSELVYETDFSQYENETIQITVAFNDLSHGAAIDWGSLTIELDGSLYVMTYNDVTERYTLSIWLDSTIDPGIYNLTLNAEAVDCLPVNGTIQLEVLSKATYVLNIESEREVVAGNTLDITVIATEEGAAATGLQINLYIVATVRDGGERTYIEVVITNSEGIATLNFEVPEDVSELSILAQYDGSVSEWPAESTSILVEVSSAGPDILTLLLDPLTLTIILGGASIPLVAVSLRRRRRHSGSVKATIEETEDVSVDSTPTSQGIGEKLRHEIMSSEDGLTRAELSKRLGPSASKIGAMVKDLLQSDSGFYEVREGSRRVIKYRRLD